MGHRSEDELTAYATDKARKDGAEVLGRNGYYRSEKELMEDKEIVSTGEVLLTELHTDCAICHPPAKPAAEQWNCPDCVDSTNLPVDLRCTNCYLVVPKVAFKLPFQYVKTHPPGPVTQFTLPEKGLLGPGMQADNFELGVGGIKHDANKLPYDLVPWDAVDEVVSVLRFGAGKYAARNWEQGVPFRWGRMSAAAFRHLKAWSMGEDNDPETGISHLAHCMCMLLFLLAHVLRKRGHDDRMLVDQLPPGEYKELTPDQMDRLLRQQAARTPGGVVPVDEFPPEEMRVDQAGLTEEFPSIKTEAVPYVEEIPF